MKESRFIESIVVIEDYRGKSFDEIEEGIHNIGKRIGAIDLDSQLTSEETSEMAKDFLQLSNLLEAFAEIEFSESELKYMKEISEEMKKEDNNVKRYICVYTTIDSDEVRWSTHIPARNQKELSERIEFIMNSLTEIDLILVEDNIGINDYIPKKGELTSTLNKYPRSLEAELSYIYVSEGWVGNEYLQLEELEEHFKDKEIYEKAATIRDRRSAD